jgi:hypothetical protein
MERQQKMQSKVMKAAWKIFKKRYKVKSMKNWSKSLKRAWSWAKQNLIKKRVVGEILKETEKAILMSCVVEEGANRYMMKVWFPKSQIEEDYIPMWLLHSKTRVGQNFVTL